MFNSLSLSPDFVSDNLSLSLSVSPKLKLNVTWLFFYTDTYTWCSLSKLAPERDLNLASISRSLVEALALAEGRRVQMKCDRCIRVAGVFHSMKTNSICTKKKKRKSACKNRGLWNGCQSISRLFTVCQNQTFFFCGYIWN